jgi:hypothetical protein
MGMQANLQRMYNYFQGVDEQGKPTGKRPTRDMVGPAVGAFRETAVGIPDAFIPDQWQDKPEDAEVFANFRAESQTFFNAMIRAITGAAMQNTEGPRIKAQIPHTRLKDVDWLANYKASINNMQNVRNVLAQRGMDIGLNPLPGAQAAAARRANGIPDQGLANVPDNQLLSAEDQKFLASLQEP